MEANTENLRTLADPGREADRREADATRAWGDAVEHFRRVTDWEEVSDALVGSEQYLNAALLANDPLLIGRIVLAVRDAKVQRLAQREVLDRITAPTDEQAAALAYIQWSRQ